MPLSLCRLRLCRRRYVDDVDTIATEFGVEVDTQPWAREIQLTDPLFSYRGCGPMSNGSR